MRSDIVPAAFADSKSPQTLLLLAVTTVVLLLPTFVIELSRIAWTPVAETIIPIVCVLKLASGVLLFTTLEIVLP